MQKTTKQAGILIKSKVILYMQYTNNQLEKNVKEMRNEKTKVMIARLLIGVMSELEDEMIYSWELMTDLFLA